jgi:hypothetical protein
LESQINLRTYPRHIWNIFRIYSKFILDVDEYWMYPGYMIHLFIPHISGIPRLGGRNETK